MKRKNKQKTNMRPNEKFRYRVQRFLSKTNVTASISVATSILWFFVLVWALEFLFTTFPSVLSGTSTGLSMPNPFIIRAEYKWFYLLAACFSVFWGVKLAFRLKVAYEPLKEEGQADSQRWALPEEIEAQYVSIPATAPPSAKKKETLGDIPGRGGVPVSRYNDARDSKKDRLYIDRDAVNNLFLGMTRSGKGELYVFPLIDIYSRPIKIEDKASMVIADLKGELSASSIDILKKRGYNVLIFTLIPPMDGIGYNPLTPISDAYRRYLDALDKAANTSDSAKKNDLLAAASTDEAFAETMARSLAYIIAYDPTEQQKIWSQWATAMVTALILAVVIDCCKAGHECEKHGDMEGAKQHYQKINLYSVASLMVDYTKPNPKTGQTPLDAYMNTLPRNVRVQYASIESNDYRTKGNITGSTQARLNQLMLTPIARMMSKNEIDFKEIGFGEKPTALFVCLPPKDQSNYFVVTMLMTQMSQILENEVRRSHKSRLPRDVIFILDEFGNMPALPSMGAQVSMDLSLGIRYNLFIQSYAQLDSVYGKDDATKIKDNCGNHFYLLANQDSAKMFSEEIGYYEAPSISRYGQSPLSTQKQITESLKKLPLLDANQLKELGEGETVLVRTVHRTDLKGRPITQYPIFNTGRNEMKYRYQYLSDTFPNRSYADLHLAQSCTYLSTDIESLVYVPEFLQNFTFEDTENQADGSSPSTQSQDSTPETVAQLSNSTQKELLRRLILFGIPNDILNEMKSWTLAQLDDYLQTQADEGVLTDENYGVIYELLNPMDKGDDFENEENNP